MNIAAVGKKKKKWLDLNREVGNVVHQYIMSFEKGYGNFLVLEDASDKEAEESTWHQASDNLLPPN
jgi:hypothetical protein